MHVMYVELTDQGVSIIRLTKIRLKKERTDEEHQDVFVGLFRNKSSFSSSLEEITSSTRECFFLCQNRKT